MARNIFSEVLAWSKELSPWQNEAIRRLFAKGVLTPTDKDEIFELAKIEHGLATAPPQPVDLMLKAADLPTPPTPGQKLQLNGVRELVNVNALRGDRLTIGKQLTVVYGENATGKSGYARVMKKAFRARAVDPILRNVYSSATFVGPASAVFEIEEAGKMRDEKWTDGVQSAECLGRFAVFDSKCARVYVSESNELTFVPYGFDIIHGLGVLTDEVKRRFQDLAKSTTPKPDALQPLIDDTTIGKRLAALTDASKESDITVMSTQEFSTATKRLALVRQKFRCASCGTHVTRFGEAGRSQHPFGEVAHAHHIRHVKFGGTNSIDNCVILCQTCHYSAHEGGNYRRGTVVGETEDFPHFNG
jgi:hypothetical protein